MSNPMPQPNIPLPSIPQPSGSPVGGVPAPSSQPGTVPMPHAMTDPQAGQPQFTSQSNQNFQPIQPVAQPQQGPGRQPFNAPVSPEFQQQETSQFNDGQYQQGQSAYATSQPAPQNPPIDPTVQQYQPRYDVPVQTGMAPVGQLYTGRSLVKWILLGIITLGIYNIVIMTGATDSLNTVAGRYDGKKTMHYCLLYFLVGPITLGIASLVWYHKMSNRIGDELQRRGYARELSASDFWLWDFLGSLIIVGPFIYFYKYLNAINTLCADYNQRG
ncbi:DUF4234 domain-containing protein [Bifidobacterium sp. ESL0800]|uniref:DUF4234 domain-containing protein n=1 Tax=Bifidobacterium sp. ESL0800 TaxID=2983236 RepID=UPI0023F7FE0D|nr:DUF4234 domain-containing protein [Bifidobacterium sp. ESL0800]WEV76369.1 DUF4234 domain-containing protein [Bifidobacterium sp. ESL0800]